MIMYLALNTLRHPKTLSLPLQAVSVGVLLLQAISLRTQPLLLVLGSTAGLQYLISTRLFSMYKSGSWVPVPSFYEVASALWSLFTPRGINALVYSVMTVAFAVQAYGMFFSFPGAPLHIFEGRQSKAVVTR